MTSMKNILYFIIFLFSVGFSQEDNINLSGYVKSNSSGETLIGANVIVKELNVGCTTNNYGFFSLTLPLGSYTLETSYIGYKNVQIEISESKENLIFNLNPTSYLTNEVIVKAKKEDANIQDANMGKIELELEQVDQIPVLMGEKDLLLINAMESAIKEGHSLEYQKLIYTLINKDRKN